MKTAVVTLCGVGLVGFLVWAFVSGGKQIREQEAWYEACEARGGMAVQQRFSIQYQLDHGKGALKDNYQTVCLQIFKTMQGVNMPQLYQIVNFYPFDFDGKCEMPKCQKLVLTCNDEDIRNGACTVHK